MPIDASAVASATGIDVQYRDLRGGSVLFLPQQIAVFAQGANAAAHPAGYSLDKFQITSAGQAGNRYGFGSPAHLIAQQLFPANGDGVGTIPVTVYPLPQPGGGGAPAVGAITPSGTQTSGGSYRVRIGGVLSAPFSIAANASMTTVSNAMGGAINAVLSMPMVATFTYDTVTSEKTVTIGTSDGTIGTFTTTGNPKPGVWTIECTAEASNAGTFTVTDPDGLVAGTVTTMGAHVVGGLGFTLTDGAEDFDTGDTFEVTVPATASALTAKWDGLSGNDLVIEVLGESRGVTFAITQPTGGLLNPTVDDALEQVGDQWETMFLNALNISDTTALDAFQTFGEGRWNELVGRPCVVFTGNTLADVAAATAVSSARQTDRVNGQLVAPGSVNLPFVVAARQLARIVRMAQNNPATGYTGLRATGILPGTDSEQWNHAQRDQAIKAGSSTVQVKDGVVNIGQIVTFYRPTGEEPPAYRFVRGIVKLQQIVYNTDLIFSSQQWAAAPLIPDDQPTVNPNARKASSAKSAVAGMIDSLADQAIISDPKTAKQSIVASISSSNPNRLDLTYTVQLSGNSDIKGIGLNFGYYFGSPEAVG
jgi:phage tail sheath gpL-like